MGKGMKPAKFQDSIKISENMAKVKRNKEFVAHKELIISATKKTYVY